MNIEAEKELRISLKAKQEAVTSLRFEIDRKIAELKQLEAIIDSLERILNE